jgi:hypothetical protein
MPDQHLDPAAPAPDWPTCQSDVGGQRCIGIRVAPFVRCLAHLTPTALDQALSALGPEADLDARGTPFTPELLDRVVETFRADDTKPHFGTARFDRAQFSGTAGFGDARFHGGAEFADARFSGNARFDGVRFHGYAEFGDARFSGYASFADARFSGIAGFGDARFSRNAGFEGAQFSLVAEFNGAQFSGNAGFDNVQFEKVDRLGPVTVAGDLVLDRAVFGQPVQIEAAAGEVSVWQVTFAAGATLRLRYAAVILDGLVSNGPVTVVGAAQPFMLSLRRVDESLLAEASRDATPSLLSLRGVDASRLVLVNLNLCDCRFAEAHHLDQLRIEGRCRFADTPGWARLRWVPVWRCTRRQALAEERTWRAAHHGMPWTNPRPGPTGEPDPPLEAERLTALYRQLRKAQEDARNEPGAADFYYGEMEMRRHASSTPIEERLILTAYWVLSGYGLRASRALVAVLVVLALATAGFATVGFAPSERMEYHPVDRAAAGQAVAYRQVTVPGPRPGWSAALDHSIDSTISLLRATQPQPLTLAGRVFEIALRLLGPVLLGLAVLAVRNRVKR